jgi:hypothetical protein
MRGPVCIPEGKESGPLIEIPILKPEKDLFRALMKRHVYGFKDMEYFKLRLVLI